MNIEEQSQYSSSEDEEDFLSTDSNEEENGQQEEVDEDERVYALPPLPPVSAPTQINGIPTSEIYRYIAELRKRVDGTVEREQAAKVLQGETNVLMAVVQVLQESNLLHRVVVKDDGEVSQELVPQPEMQRLALPTGYTSWIVE